MQALFLTLYPESTASSRYRVSQFVPFLSQFGIECTIAAALSDVQYARYKRPGAYFGALRYHLTELSRRVGQLVKAGRYDVVVVQKALLSVYLKGMPALLRRYARRIVYDIDDAVHLVSPNPVPLYWRWWEDKEQILKIFGMSDLVLAGNHWLKTEAERCGARAVLFPTVVDTERFVPVAHGTAEPYTVGWLGSPSTTPSLSVIGADLSLLENVRLVLMGADPSKVSWEKAEIVPWSLESEVPSVQRLSVGLMPLERSDWSRGKCGLKAIQYMACGVPCVATPFGAALDIIRHGETGLFADSAQEWIHAIERLRDPVLRRQMGEAARADVEKRFSLKKAIPEMATWLNAVA